MSSFNFFTYEKKNVVAAPVDPAVYINNIMRPKIDAIMTSFTSSEAISAVDKFQLENIVLTFLPHCPPRQESGGSYFPLFDSSGRGIDDFGLLVFLAANITSGGSIKIITEFYKDLRRLRENMRY